ncbi:MAG: transglutaminase family protein [Thermomicrobiales bacterium]
MSVPEHPSHSVREQDQSPDFANAMMAIPAAPDAKGQVGASGPARAYLVHQHFHYTYGGPARDLRQRLVVIPPERHGDQRLVLHHIEVSAPTSGYVREIDRFGNLRLLLLVDAVSESITFTVWFVTERDIRLGPIRVPAELALDPMWLTPTPLTQPDATMLAAARAIATEIPAPLAQAEAISQWVHAHMRYEPGTTSVQTTASEAIAQGGGVCQDYTHIMLAMCRACGIPARYVSGHLMGEGGSHAWVEVILPDPDHPGRFLAHPFDPTHANDPDLETITVALGRDYTDVTPTSGTFISAFGGRLTASKQAIAMPSAAIPALAHP